MRPIRNTIKTILFLSLCQITLPVFGQLGFTFDIKKPQEYDDRVLRSERSDQKKFNLPRRFIQNTVTHYNYYFNANNKINEILERAKTSFVDDYAQLLPFYNYSLDVTAQDSIQLDSITYKASTGIALHDLRNDWVDNLYLLWGAAYYLRKDFDSAYMMFQFINYAFAPKEKDGYYITIGSSRDGNNANSISTKEKNSLPRRVFSEPPSRNDAFIWQIRNFLAQDQLAEAASLIVTLRNDPLFPKRLYNDLHEVQSYWFYKQNMWDSAADHLVKALGNATNLQEKARWEFLAAQLYEMTGKYKEAEKLYAKVSGHTTDPIMDIYARLYSIRVNKDDGERTIEKNVAELLKMAKRDKYVDYQDIIYYMAAQMQLQGNNIDAAMALLLKSTQSMTNNPGQRNKTFLQLAEIAYGQKKYREAFNFYDSIAMDDPGLKDIAALTARKKTLGILATNMEIMERQDSLQRIAAMPEEERKEFVKKLVKELRKKQGLKDEPLTTGSSIITPTIPNLFDGGPTKGEWYFYNANSRTRGQNDFKARWGNRPNLDNWRRAATLVGLMNSGNINSGNVKTNTNAGPDGGLTNDALLANLPTTPELLKRSNDSLEAAMFALGKVYVQDIEDCAAGTQTFETLRTRFPEFVQMDEVLFNLYYCYNKNGEKAKAEAIKKLLNEKYGDTHFNTILQTGKDPLSAVNPEATQEYERIYDLFIEGNFQQAVDEKIKADSKYGKNFWTPQLLYIEAVYYIRERKDSVAKSVLNNIINQFSTSPLAERARSLIDVLDRRAQIEEELRNMVVTRNEDGAAKPIVVTPPPKKDTVVVKPIVVNNPPPKDTVAVKPVTKVNSPFKYDAGAQHYVVLILNKVDPVFSNEAKNAFFRYNRETYYNKTFSLDLFQLDGDNRLLMIAPFATAKEAIEYVDKTRPKTATEILPWLKGGKYSFAIMTDANFDLLKENKDIENYKAFLNEQVPGKF